MQRIGQFVRLRADQGRLRHVHGPVQGLGVHTAHLLGETCLHHWQQRFAEGQAAPNKVFVKPALTLVESHGSPISQAGKLQILPDAQLIQGMPALVDHAVHAGGHVVLLVMGGNAHVPAVEAIGEGMLRFSDNAAVRVQAHESHQPLGKASLILQGIMQVKEIRAWSGLFRHRPDQGRKPGPQRLK